MALYLGIILYLIIPISLTPGFSVFPDSPFLNHRQNELLNAKSWIEDLEFIVNILKTRHPNVYYQISEEEFKSLILRLNRDTNFFTEKISRNKSGGTND